MIEDGAGAWQRAGTEAGDPVRIERFADLSADILSRPARLGRTRAVAVDGPSGSGKTVFASRLARALAAAGVHVEVVHTDELLEGWGDQFTFWSRLDEGVLNPVRHGEPGSHPVYDWVAGRFDGARQVPVPDVLVVEGVTSARGEFRAELTLAILLIAGRELRLRRALARDGPGIEAPLRQWMAAEDEYFAEAARPESADQLVDGAPQVRHDPESEYVRLR
jgi:uridine kinase